MKSERSGVKGRQEPPAGLSEPLRADWEALVGSYDFTPPERLLRDRGLTWFSIADVVREEASGLTGRERSRGSSRPRRRTPVG